MPPCPHAPMISQVSHDHVHVHGGSSEARTGMIIAVHANSEVDVRLIDSSTHCFDGETLRNLNIWDSDRPPPAAAHSLADRKHSLCWQLVDFKAAELLEEHGDLVCLHCAQPLERMDCELHHKYFPEDFKHDHQDGAHQLCDMCVCTGRCSQECDVSDAS